MEEHPAAVRGLAIEIPVLAAVQRQRIPVVGISAHGRHQQREIGIEHAVELRFRRTTVGDGFEKLGERTVIILVFARTHHPLGVIADRGVRPLVTPIGIALRPIPVVQEPPFVVTAHELPVTPVGKDARNHLTIDRLRVLPDGDGVAVDEIVYEFVFVGGMTQQIQPITRQPVVMAAAAFRVVVIG